MANNQLLASDNWAGGSLAAGWSTSGFTSVKSQVVLGSPNLTEPQALSMSSGQVWTGTAFPSDQTCEVTVQTLTAEAGTAFYLGVRNSGTNGYLLLLNDGVATIQRFDSGVSTNLANASFTSAAGDVWRFQAAGSILSGYLNGARIVYAADPTYKTGGPSFIQFTSVDITHTQVASWRGYNCIQQDGIWQKQGVIIAPVAADLASTGFGVLPNSAVFYEGNAQILSGTVFKTWFGAGGASTGNIYYAESIDGINWTRKTAAVISGYMIPTVLKNVSTFYLYAQAAATQGTSDFEVFTSNDGINWTDKGDTGLGLGGVGAWDHAAVYIFQPVAIIAGTWYGLYSGTNDGTNAPFSMGLATSADGLTWTKHVGNPVLGPLISGGSVLNSQAIVKIGSTWYMWAEATQPGISSAQKGLNPTQCVRYQSTDLISWTNPVQSIHNGQMFEFLNGAPGGVASGQCIPTAIIDVGGKAYMYLNSAASNGAITEGFPSLYQVSLAIAPVPIASVVQFPEDAASSVATDNFSRADGTLGANWSTPTGGTALQIASHLCEPSATGMHCGQYYSGASFNADQYSEITLHAQIAGGFCYPLVRCQAGAVSWYEAPISGALNTVDSVAIYKMVAGTETQIGPVAHLTPQAGDVFRLQVTTGSDGFPILQLFQNGFLVMQAEDYSNQFTTGNPGISQFGSAAVTDTQISGWAGGNANVIPNYPPVVKSGGAADFLLLGCGSA